MRAFLISIKPKEFKYLLEHVANIYDGFEMVSISSIYIYFRNKKLMTIFFREKKMQKLKKLCKIQLE